MPYIARDDRSKFNNAIFDCTWALEKIPYEKRKGYCNYVISRITAIAMQPDDGWSYSSISNAISVLEDAAAEMRRRLLDPYEDGAIEKNGDLPEYE